jgi:hypothetical protein
MITTWFYAAVPCGGTDDGRVFLDYEQAIKCECAEQVAQTAAHLARWRDRATRRQRLPSRCWAIVRRCESAEHDVLARRGITNGA